MIEYVWSIIGLDHIESDNEDIVSNDIKVRWLCSAKKGNLGAMASDEVILVLDEFVIFSEVTQEEILNLVYEYIDINHWCGKNKEDIESYLANDIESYDGPQDETIEMEHPTVYGAYQWE